MPLMPFTFTFSISVPGIANPFSTHSDDRKSNPEAPEDMVSDQGYVPPPTRRRPHPATLPPPVPLSRKRGWVPAEAEPSHAATINASSNGYLDTPAKYRDMVPELDILEQEIEEMVGDLPPAKRRRTLAGSIVSTAVSAALIGTAVGLTVYRLWRDRGREPELAPPPPYEQGNWVHPQDSPNKPPVTVTPPTPRGQRSRQTPATANRRPANRHRRTRTRAQNAVAGPSRTVSPPAPAPAPHGRPEFNFNSAPIEEEEPEVDDPMDWMGDKLAKLIEEGKKALGKEVVVMSETQEDEIDDGSGEWEEELGPSASSSSRRGSFRRKNKPQRLGLPSSYSSHHISPPSSASPSRAQFSGHSLGPSYSVPGLGDSPRRLGRGASVESVNSFSSYHEDTEYLSPELRESMVQARARYLRNRS